MMWCWGCSGWHYSLEVYLWWSQALTGCLPGTMTTYTSGETDVKKYNDEPHKCGMIGDSILSVVCWTIKGHLGPQGIRDFHFAWINMTISDPEQHCPDSWFKAARFAKLLFSSSSYQCNSVRAIPGGTKYHNKKVINTQFWSIQRNANDLLCPKVAKGSYEYKQGVNRVEVILRFEML